jgi:hypothetical protein
VAADVGIKKALSGKLRASERSGVGILARVYLCPEWEPLMIAMIMMGLAEMERM